ncbi:halocyanin domain-containing protein [Halocalculus aciditolerans]|uniref:Blue (type 1) copper domain-containing protein n=1 Tax=Halocalculus aciditolerans TaxID=1383812 RepID=A0A830F438_9EURY|nr:halocyanin domain-containing protein [Halocalculus aciditolerans]GGL60679.1 hypothetical protein GCM10009039_18690 [Halocalculus aciditolerans]
MVETRRSFLRAAGVTALAATAGCITDAAETPEFLTDGPSYDGWFENTSNFTGTLDYTGRGQVEVEVGVPGNGGHFGFGPAAIKVSPRTVVRWVWTGKGGSHDVVAVDGSFESDYHHQPGASFTHQFDEQGVHRYVCEAHAEKGMRGAVVVGH